jgi:hypothetical protein
MFRKQELPTPGIGTCVGKRDQSIREEQADVRTVPLRAFGSASLNGAPLGPKNFRVTRPNSRLRAHDNETEERAGCGQQRSR